MFLGTGAQTGGGFFTAAAQLTLPGALAIRVNEQATRCAPPATGTTQFTTYQTAGLRDLTGDGIADYVTADGKGAGTVRFGTGTGFLAAIPIHGFVALSSQTKTVEAPSQRPRQGCSTSTETASPKCSVPPELYTR